MAVVVAEAVDTDPPSSGRNPPTHVLPSSFKLKTLDSRHAQLARLLKNYHTAPIRNRRIFNGPIQYQL